MNAPALKLVPDLPLVNPDGTNNWEERERLSHDLMPLGPDYQNVQDTVSAAVSSLGVNQDPEAVAVATRKAVFDAFV